MGTFLSLGRLALIFALASQLVGCGKGDTPPAASSTYLVTRESATPTDSLVVFVHGVLGDARGTWANPNDKDGWPGLLVRDLKAPKVDAMSLGYRSSAVSEASNIEEIAVRSLQALKDSDVFQKYDKVGFVVHSMGGLVAKRMLRILQTEDATLLRKVRVIVFLSTPSHGSNVAEMASWISSNPQFNNMSPADFNAFLQVLDNDWKSLLRQRPADSSSPKSFCAYETMSMGNVRVVPRSASEGGCDSTPVPFDRDHLSMAKPQTTEDDVYVFVRSRLAAAFDGSATAQKISASLVKENGVPLALDEPMKSGDKYFILLESTRPAWFYVNARDSRDKRQRYFPSAAAGRQSVPLTRLRVPVDEDRFLTLDDAVGIERIYIAATEKPDARLEQLKEVAEGKSAEADRLLADELRGSYVAVSLKKGGQAAELPSSKDSSKAYISFEHK